jgi:hypothetical protein
MPASLAWEARTESYSLNAVSSGEIQQPARPYLIHTATPTAKMKATLSIILLQRIGIAALERTPAGGLQLRVMRSEQT